jgi:sulfofructose kinase
VGSVVTVGHAVLDHRFRVSEFPPTRSRTDADAYWSDVGGPAAVAAIAVVRLGGRARLLAVRGADDAGALLSAGLTAHGVDLEGFIVRDDVETPVCAVLVDPGGERFIFRRIARSFTSDAGWVTPERFEGVGAVLVHPLWAAGADAAVRCARALDLPCVLDLDHVSPATMDLAARVTHVIADASAAQALGGVEDAAAALRGTGAWWAITLGAKGVRHAGGTVAALSVPVLDSTGAGDVFHGAFALALAEGRGEDHALRFATIAAALHVRDARIPDRAAVRGYLEERHV